MKLERLALVTALALGAAACAADRSKEVRHAETKLTSEQQEARRELARLDQKHADEQAVAQQTMSTEERAELQTKHIEERAEETAEGMKEIAEADKDVASAQAALRAERTKVEADAKERLVKASAKASEALNKSAKVPADKRAKFNAEMNTFNAKKAEVQTRVSNLGRASNEEWNDAKAKLDKSLDHLEDIADRLDDVM